MLAKKDLYIQKSNYIYRLDMVLKGHNYWEIFYALTEIFHGRNSMPLEMFYVHSY